MGELDSTIQKLQRVTLEINGAIEDALRNEVAEVIKKYVIMTARRNVYDAYEPKIDWRRYGSGGILDPNSIYIEVHGNELIAADTYPSVSGRRGWQQRFGGRVPDGRLAEAIAEGDPRFHMDEAGPRPFHEEAKRAAINSGELEIALLAGLRRQGYDTTEMTITFY